MNPHSAASAYAEGNIENAPPIKIVRLLYQGALRFIDRALRAEPGDPRSRFVHWLGRAEDIVVELRCHLDEEPAPEIAAHLTQLYLFVEERLQQAMNERSHEPLKPARDVLAKLLEAWSAIELETPAP